MTDFIKPPTMILTLQALQYQGRCQLSVGLIACFRLTAPHLDALLTETAAHQAWSRLAGPFTPIDSGIPTKEARLIVHDGYTASPASPSPSREAQPPLLLGTESFRLESRLSGRPRVYVRLPGIRAQCFVEWRGTRGEVVRKLDARIESLRFSPRMDCAWILHRAVTPLGRARIGDIVRVSADWGAIDQPTARPGHRLPEGADRCTVGRHRHATEREMWRHGLAGSTCEN